MKKFVVLYYSPAGAMEKMQTSSQEDMQAEMKRWMDWFDGLGDNLVEMGEMFKQGAELSKDGFSDCSGKVTGYTLVQAESFEAAKQLIKDHPHVTWFDGCTVEVYEPMEMNHEMK